MKLMQFTALIEGLAELLDSGITLPEFYDEVLDRTGYVDMLNAKPTEENKTRLENVRELKSSINSYVENAETPTLAGFLEEIALYTDLEQVNASEDAVVMMTMHSAKGLEFPHVFLVGFEDGLFPGMRAIGDREEMEEERRLCYVAFTRAEDRLYLSDSTGLGYDGVSRCPSRFLLNAGAENVDYHEPLEPALMEDARRIISKTEELEPGRKDPFAPGTRVKHPILGGGTVLAPGEGGLIIQFDKMVTPRTIAPGMLSEA